MFLALFTLNAITLREYSHAQNFFVKYMQTSISQVYIDQLIKQVILFFIFYQQSFFFMVRKPTSHHLEHPESVKSCHNKACEGCRLLEWCDNVGKVRKLVFRPFWWKAGKYTFRFTYVSSCTSAHGGTKAIYTCWIFVEFGLHCT